MAHNGVATRTRKELTMKLCHVTIQTARFEEEIGFYSKYAGLTVQRDMRPMGRNIVFLADTAGDTEVEIIENPEAAASGNAHLSIGFAAEDLDSLHAALAEDGLEPTDYVSPMPSVRFFFVRDPAGVSVQFM